MSLMREVSKVTVAVKLHGEGGSDSLLNAGLDF